MEHRRPHWLAFWPGLGGLWLRGDWGALAIAVSFSLLLNLAILNTFLWPEFPGERFAIVAWPVVILAWGLSFWLHLRQPIATDKSSETGRNADVTLFNRAQTEYLKGNWHECQRLLTKRLGDHARDLESRLLLATVLRRLGDHESALGQLRTLRKLDGWEGWQAEVSREESLLQSALSESDRIAGTTGSHGNGKPAESETIRSVGLTTRSRPNRNQAA